MADSVSSARRSEIMSHIKSEDTSIELLVRRKLFSMGYSYRVNYKVLPGKPDIVFTKKKVAIFLFTAVIGMDMIAEAGMHTPVRQTSHTGHQKLSGRSSGIKSTFRHLRLMVGKPLTFGNVRLENILIKQ